ncbi:MAG: response regulator [Campylobacterales bacterium]
MKNLTILYVEDEPDIAGTLINFLRRRFGRVLYAPNGAEGLSLFKSESVDLILTDIQMPVMNGLEMIRQIRESDENIPVVITTAFNEVEYLLKAIDVGVDKYLKKPIDRDELLKVLSKASEAVIYRRQVEDRERIIREVLSWHPYFAILTDGENINVINDSFLDFLGYESYDDFVTHHLRLESISDIVQEAMQTDMRSFWKALLENCQQEQVIYLKSRKDGSIRGYKVKCYDFAGTGHYLLAFSDPARDLPPEVERWCNDSSGCTVCRIVGG